MFVLFFFFFQAEDGIRDIGVTGVQTCALPICYGEVDEGAFPSLAVGATKTIFESCWNRAIAMTDEEAREILAAKLEAGSAFRSEERRVGKSVDLGGRRIIKKKK